MLRVTNTDRQTLLGDRIRLADRWWSRLIGLLGALPLERGGGLLLRPCRGVHMFGMTQPLDVAFLDREGLVVAVYAPLRPWRATRLHPNAAAALELPAGVVGASGTAVGDRLAIL